MSWTEEAAQDLEEIIEFIARERLSSAKKVYKNIRDNSLKLEISPTRFRRVPELLDLGLQNYREFISSPYRVIYKLSQSSVFIIAVVDSHRDFEDFILYRLTRITKTLD